jgi:hypothetical protein
LTDAPVTIRDEHDEIELLVVSARNWIERAMKKEIKRPPEAIERMTRRLAAREAALARYAKAIEAGRT